MCARGIDVSDYQGRVDWTAVANSGMSFGVTKATEGATFVADTFVANWTGIRSVGLVRGAYHFFRPKTDARAQAENFLRIVKLETGDLPPVLDIETTDGMSGETIAARMETWLTIVERETQRRPLIYTYPGFWERIGDMKRFSDYPLWIAHYTDASEPFVPGGWGTWTFWQYTDRGSVNGVLGGVDVNWFNTVKVGSTNSVVKDVQKRLNEKGGGAGTVDGIFGSGTEAAVKKFQQAIGATVDGIVGPQTWSYLMDSSLLPKFPDPEPKPEVPSPSPSPSPSPDSIRLSDVARYYDGMRHQQLALDWLQRQIPQATLEEFTRRWRNTTTMSSVIQFRDVAKYYQGLPNQQKAIDWLQSQLSRAILDEFAQKWRNPSATVEPYHVRFVDVAKYYQGLPQQDRALAWLQSQLSDEMLAEFTRLWRGS